MNCKHAADYVIE